MTLGSDGDAPDPERRRIWPASSRLTGQWGITLLGSLVSVVLTVGSLLAGVEGPLSIAIGLAGIAVALLLQVVGMLSDATAGLAKLAASELATRATLLAASAKTSTALDLWNRGSNTGRFEGEVDRLICIAQESVQTQLDPVLTDHAVRVVRQTLESIASISEGRLTASFSFSHLLLDLMAKSQVEVLGASPVGLEEHWWNLPLYQQYLDHQREATEGRKVKIVRIFSGPQLDRRVYEIMANEQRHGVAARWALSSYVDADLQEAYVLFDGRVLHRTRPTNEPEDENVFSQNASDISQYRDKFARLHTFSQAFDQLKEP